MADQESPEPVETDHSYLDVYANGLPTWLLVVGALLIGMAVVAVFYGLYTLNRGSSPTVTPGPPILVESPSSQETAPPPGTPLVAITPTPTVSETVAISPTAEPPTYTVVQGDTLIDIAHRLNVNTNDLSTLNQLGGETIYPGQVLLVPPTVTPWPETGPFLHVVSQGETLLSIATRYEVQVDEIKALNGLTSDTIFAGQEILIPGHGVRPPTPTPTPEPWQPAVITGDLESIYSLATIKGYFTLHVAPDTRAADEEEMDRVARLVKDGLAYVHGVVQRRFSGRFEAYAVDSLFGPPFTHRRSLGLPEQGQLWMLYDGSGTPTERLYFATYALTPMVVTQTLGPPCPPGGPPAPATTSAGGCQGLGEGLAVYVAGQALSDASDRYLTLNELCAAYQAAGKLPRVTHPLVLEGHLGHLDQYLAAGCFAGFLIERDGWRTFAEIYQSQGTSGDYQEIYGRTLYQLETEWVATLRDAADDLPFDPDELARIGAAIDAAYVELWADFEGRPSQFAVYERLDRARLSLLQGRLSAAQAHLEALEELLE